MAKTQDAYNSAVKGLFHHLDRVEAHFNDPKYTGPFYYGSSITEADIRLYVTIIRFDPVYFTLFKTNRALIRFGYPKIHRWAQNLYWNVPEFRETTNFKHIKGHYFMSLTMINPTGIIPDGPYPNILPIENSAANDGH